MRGTSGLVFVLAAALSLSGCANDFLREAGAEVDEGGFGNPNMNNTLLMTGQASYTVALAERFAREVPATITFPFNSSSLTSEAQTTLRRQADWIRQFPEVRFRVYGHTDLVGSNAYNKALGLRRAKATVAYLSTLGISTSRLEAVASFGKTQPVVQTSGPEERNRRTVTEVTGFVKGHPMLLNGKYAAVIFREYVEGATRPHPDVAQTPSEVDPGG
jgi:outer membrane protein OmpA-like peptidoglycan-associated protein